jgi:ATP-dependent DNA ligase
MLSLINPVPLAEPFDHPNWLLEAKFDGFRAIAGTDRGRLISRNGNRMKQFEAVLDRLPKSQMFDGEIVVLDDAGRPHFNELLFGRRRPTYVAFDLLMADAIATCARCRSVSARRRWRASARARRTGSRAQTVSWAKGGRCSGRWSRPTSRASSPSV